MNLTHRLTVHCLAGLALALSAASLCVAQESTDPDAPKSDPVVLQNWEAYAVIDKNFHALDCESINQFPPEEIDDHLGQVWLPVTGGQTQRLTPQLYQRIHHGVPDETAARLFADADRNGDGQVSLEESRDQFVRLIEQLDIDKNRWLTRAELDQSEPGAPLAKQVGADTEAKSASDGAQATLTQTHPTADHAHHHHAPDHPAQAAE